MTMHEKYCEWCGSVLLENGRCPIEDCVQNVILDALKEAEKESKQESEDNKNEPNQTV